MIRYILLSILQSMLLSEQTDTLRPIRNKAGKRYRKKGSKNPAFSEEKPSN